MQKEVLTTQSHHGQLYQIALFYIFFFKFKRAERTEKNKQEMPHTDIGALINVGKFRCV